jgi:hypothetical protein
MDANRKIFLVLLLILHPVVLSADIIPSGRLITYEGYVGVDGDIPTRETIYATIETASQGDDTSAIQTALNNCPSGQVVKLGAGTFTTSSALTVKSNTTLRGSGIDSTIIRNTSSVTYVVGFNNSANESFSGISDKNISSGLTKGSTQITTSSAHGWQVDDLILIDQLEDPTGDPPISSTGDGRCSWCGRDSGNRPFGQIVKVTSVPDSTTVGFSPPLYYAYTETPQGIELSGVTVNAGIEDLYIDSSDTCPDDNYGSIALRIADNCWVYNVEIYRTCRIGIGISNSYRNTIRGVIIHKTVEPHTSNRGYQIWLMNAASGNVIENSIFYDGLVGIIYNGAVSGNVVAYNYITNMYHDSFPGQGWYGISYHGAAPFFNLFEGNYLDGNQVGGDFAWGTGFYEVYYRNRIKLDTSLSANQLKNIPISEDGWYMTFAGNIIGTTGHETQYEGTSLYDSTPGIYYAGDSTTLGKFYRHGNWDSVNEGVVWDVTNEDHSFVDSLYLSGKPG